MIPGPAPRARRWAAICLPIVAVVILCFVGRRATNAATPIATPAASSPVLSESVPISDAGAPVDAVVVDDASAEAARPAIEQLADGGVVVDLNLASETELRKLPGVGPTRARKIVELRTHLGRFKSVDDLARIKGFGKATIRRLRPMIRIS